MISLHSPAVSGNPAQTYQSAGRAVAAARRRGQRVRCRIRGECGGYLVQQARKSSGGAPRMKVSDKGGVTFRGVVGTNAKFGVTLYPVTLQWLFANREQIEAFLEQHRDQLSWEKPKSQAG
jgi:hypothetical protein